MHTFSKFIPSFWLLISCFLTVPGSSLILIAGSTSDIIDLKGEWRFKIDAAHDSDPSAGFRHQMNFPLTITLPGSMDEAGYGIKTVDKNPWKLNRLVEYVGPAYYQKVVEVPDDWRDRTVCLFLERVHWESRLWVNGKFIGSGESLSTPHIYDLSEVVVPGKNIITLRVDNSMKYDIGINAHSITEHTQTNWNGIIGRMELQAKDKIYTDDIQIYPDIANKTVKLVMKVINRTGRPGRATIRISAQSTSGDKIHKTEVQSIELVVSGQDTVLTLTHEMGKESHLWAEFSPDLYQLKVALSAGKDHRQYQNERTCVFGMRSFKTNGRQFTINGKPTFLRGTLECCIFPLTGYPDMTLTGWRRILKIARSFGLNHIRFHSWCPPEAAFEAADQLGFYLHIEGPFWTKVGDGNEIDRYIYEEIDRILRVYGNHPSFCLLAYGNEPGGDHQIEFLAELVDSWKSKDPRHLYTAAAGWPVLAQNEFMSNNKARIQRWAEGRDSRVNAAPLNTMIDYREIIDTFNVPVISHEIGQWCAYPDLSEIEKYTGVLRAGNFEIVRESLARNHMLDQAGDFLMASGKLQTILYKEDIESALRTPEFGGFQLLDLHDFPGQGTALVGVLNAFWEEKGYVGAKQFRQFCGPVVPLLRSEKFVYTPDEIFKAGLECANYGPEDLNAITPLWQIQYPDGKVFASGKLERQDIPCGQLNRLGEISVPLDNLTEAVQLKVTVEFPGREYSNQWNLWIYPPLPAAIEGDDILISGSFDQEVIKALKNGRKVMLLADAKQKECTVLHGFSSIFWNTEWTHGQPPHTLGILCDPQHPALSGFPTSYHSDWQWWDLNAHACPLVLDQLPADLQPIIQVVDDWNSNRRLGLVIEVRVGDGRLLVCSIDLTNNLEIRPVARRLRYSLEKYVKGPAFNPAGQIDSETAALLFGK